MACGVWLIVQAAIVRGGYNVLMEEGEYSRANKEEAKRSRTISTVYWSLAVAGYLAYSFITMDWQRSWIVWPVAGVFFGLVMAVAAAVHKRESR